MMKCPYCERDDNASVPLNQGYEYSGLEVSVNRQGELRVRYYEDVNQNFVSQDIVEINFCPNCGKRFIK